MTENTSHWPEVVLRPFIEPPHRPPPPELDALLLEVRIAWEHTDVPRIAAALLMILRGGPEFWAPRYASFDRLCMREFGYSDRFAREIIAKGVQHVGNGGANADT